ncbi:helix-turn-helix domain-containing protein [Metallumcola ferriviriculae]|uniref:Helix-turn-helix domain-containing protein n=1 Tax=Metallumcola ferriviriculae TaxID=3039180 RepID=A0AAU0UMJ9_9FIRM|nr:helix-turn-helix domain-containing protein [Desulfitibacteraceae bacterium MK1]
MSNNLAQKIRHLLAVRNLNQAELVRLSGLSKATVSDLINGKQKSASVKTIQQLSKALRVSSQYFLEEDTVTPLELTSHLPDHIRDFILNSENMDYIILAHKLKSKELPPKAVEKIIETYEALMLNRKE